MKYVLLLAHLLFYLFVFLLIVKHTRDVLIPVSPVSIPIPKLGLWVSYDTDTVGFFDVYIQYMLFVAFFMFFVMLDKPT